MLSDRERRELKALAQSDAIRQEFRRLRETAHPPVVNLEHLMNFLTTMNRFAPPPRRPPRLQTYTNIRL